MTSARAAAALASLALSGCGDGVLDAFLSLPPSEGAATVVVGVTERSTTRVYVGDLTSDDALTLTLGVRSADDAPVGLAYFTRTTAGAGLTPGWQDAVAPGQSAPALAEGGDAVLGGPLAVFETDLNADPPAWVRVERLAPEVSTFRPAEVHFMCPTFAPPRFTRQLPLAAAWGVALSDTVALLGSLNQQYALVSRDGTFAMINPAIAYTAGVVVDGSLYLGTWNGRVIRGEPDPEAVVRNEATLGDTLYFPVRGLAVGAADDIFALLSTGDVHHFDGVAWTSWGQADDLAGELTWIGPSEALLTSDRAELVYHAVQGGLRPETVEGVGVLSVAHVPGVGTLGGTSDGDILLRDASGWRGIGSPRYGWWALDILPRPGGAMFLLASGWVGSYGQEEGFCGDLFYGRTITKGRLVAVGDEILWVGRLPDQQLTDVFWLPAL
ncbi:MAG: hypothetical protein H6730_00660 [Deltaproteobacteria bacterium]|nr:hypothetical protein [Deltaproteobacteria bacterium]